MNKHVMSSLLACAGLLLLPAKSYAVVEYVRVCSIYGAGFSYIPGTDTCVNPVTGDARVQTEGGTWRSMLPYPDGNWVKTPHQDCGNGRVVPLGTFASTDFLPNVWNRKQTRPIPLRLKDNEFVSKVIMGGGFFNPRLPQRHGVNGIDGICVRSIDPGVMENQGGQSVNPPFGNGMIPIGCVANSRMVGMPASYSVSATSSYPNVDSYFLDGDQTNVAGPYVYGSKLVVTTDFGGEAGQLLTYFDARAGNSQPLAGNVTVSLCVQQGDR